MRGRSLEKVLHGLGPEALLEALRAWERGPSRGSGAGTGRRDRGRMEKRLAGLMRREGLAARKVRRLSPKLQALLQAFLSAPGYSLPEERLLAEPPRPLVTARAVQACLAALERDGLLFPIEGEGEKTVWGIPSELAGLLLWLQRREEVGLAHPLTLEGFLERKSWIEGGGKRSDPRTRQYVHRILSSREGILKRMERLSPSLLEVTRRALEEQGGILPLSVYRKMEDVPPWGGGRWRAELEREALGTVRFLPLVRYGVDLKEECLILFLETCRAVLGGARLDQPPPERESLSGVDLVSNLSRLIHLAGKSPLRLTDQGKPHKWVEKKVREALLPMGGGTVSSEEAFRFLVRYAWSRGLLEAEGDRWVPSPEGERAGALDLEERTRDMLEFAIKDRSAPGEPYHQVRMRKRLLVFLGGLEAGEWTPPMALPFLARNAHLADLNVLEGEGFYEGRLRRAYLGSLETPFLMAFHLRDWVQRRLHLLGLVDLGFREGRPAGFALTAMGEKILGTRAARGMEEPGGSEGLPPEEGRSSLLVTPDFEVLLFPGAGMEEAVHFLDRFAQRTVSDQVVHFQLSRESVARGIQGGLEGSDILEWLEERCRAPLPGNVRWALSEWGERAGLRRTPEGHYLVEGKETLVDRILSRADLEEYLLERPGPGAALLDGRLPRKKLEEALKDAGFFS